MSALNKILLVLAKDVKKLKEESHGRKRRDDDSDSESESDSDIETCHAYTKNGDPCENAAKYGSYCGIHDKRGRSRSASRSRSRSPKNKKRSVPSNEDRCQGYKADGKRCNYSIGFGKKKYCGLHS